MAKIAVSFPGKPRITHVDMQAGTIYAKCWKCGSEKEVQIKVEDYNQFESWLEGALIQRALPYLSADDREILISGTCGSCFDAMFR